MNKPTRPRVRPLSDLIGPCLGEAFARQGFASTAIVTRWAEIVGRDIAEHAEPLQIKWPRTESEQAGVATLVLRVEGPIALEIQHQSGIILERVNRFFGWQAVGRLAIRQAPLARHRRKPVRPAPDAAAIGVVAAGLPDGMDGDLKQALARLGAAIKRT